jgi:flagellar biosynthesis/type III secretory pathway protein FliH
MHKLRRFLYRVNFWRSSAYHRGHEAGYRLGQANIARDQAFYERLQRYYYAHVNKCQKTKCKICKELNA